VCGIIRNGFLRKFLGGASSSTERPTTSFDRFGKGFYFTSVSSKSHAYAQNSEQGLGKGYRSMLMCRVVVGNGSLQKQDNVALKDAPPGFHSVLGEAGGSLKHDETVVYREEACQVAYLIIYSYS